jgi:hypothetical protein
MTTLEQILADLDAAEAKCREARKAIVLGDREAAVHCTRRIEFNALNATLLIRTFSDQAFPAATEHLRCGPHRPLGCSVTLPPPAQGISSDQSEPITLCVASFPINL